MKRTPMLAQQKTQVLLAQQEYDRAAYTGAKGLRDAGGAGSAAAATGWRASGAAAPQIAGRQKPSTRSTPPPTTWSSMMSISPTIRWSRRATAAFNTASPMSARFCPPAAMSSPCSTRPTSTWTSICRPIEAGKVRFGADARIVLDAYPNHRDPGQGDVHRHRRRNSRPRWSRPRTSATS